LPKNLGSISALSGNEKNGRKVKLLVIARATPGRPRKEQNTRLIGPQLLHEIRSLPLVKLSKHRAAVAAAGDVIARVA
jgi:hypothetical protein